jgi:hypothetical protein
MVVLPPVRVARFSGKDDVDSIFFFQIVPAQNKVLTKGKKA